MHVLIGAKALYKQARLATTICVETEVCSYVQSNHHVRRNNMQHYASSPNEK